VGDIGGLHWKEFDGSGRDGVGRGGDFVALHLERPASSACFFGDSCARTWAITNTTAPTTAASTTPDITARFVLSSWGLAAFQVAGKVEAGLRLRAATPAPLESQHPALKPPQSPRRFA